ncbi:MAG: C25 family cysteine peptidase, partial [Nitrospirota bacterium]
PITFSAADLVTANVPGGGAVYAGNASVNQGAITGQPAIGGTGNITWDPGTVAAGTNAAMSYQVDVTPSAAGQRLPVTGTPASNGTTARYVDETGNTTQTRATYTFGPLCELAVTQGTLVPTLAIISSFRAYEYNGQAAVEWTTSSEVDTAGFYLYRLDESRGKFKIINHDILPALLTSPQGGTYRLIDSGASFKKANTYLLVEIEGRGGKNYYGPFTVRIGGGVHNTDTLEIADPELISGYTRKAHAVSAEKKARIKVRKAAIEKAGILKKARRGDMAKISIDKEGLYYIDTQEISSLLGIPQKTVKNLITRGRLAISSRGMEVAYIPSSDDKGIFFYGHGIDSIYTKENIYWLYIGRGQQMERIEGNGPPPSSGHETFTDSKHMEEDKFAVPVLTQDPESDYWFWDYIISGDPSMGVRSFTIHAEGVADMSAGAQMTVRLQGFTDTASNPDHHVIVSLNGMTIGEDRWDGTAQHEVVLSFDQRQLYEGDNTVTITGLLDTGAPYSMFYIDSFDITYQRLYQAKGNTLLLRGDGNSTITAYGFTSPDISVFDLTDPDRPGFNTATTISGSAGNYSISFTPSSPQTPYLVITAGAAVTGVNAWADSPSTLLSTKNMADYIIITTEELADAAHSYAGYRESRGLKTMVVMVEDIMDEFNYGISGPDAIHDFLSHAYRNWSGQPKYVLLAGEGTYDYKDNLGYGDNLIPVKMVSTPFGLSPSDNYFADADGDHVPDMAIGRLPAAADAELYMMLKKIKSYEPGRMKRMLWVADNPDDAGDFPSDSDEIAGMIPPQYRVEKIYLSEHPLEYARQRLLEGINNGALFLNYIGHAAVDRFAGEGLLMTGDVNSLMNGNKLPVVTAMTCVAGQFALPGYDSLSESLVTKDNGGSIAFFGPAGMALNLNSKELAGLFYQGIFTEGETVLGEAVKKAFEKYNAMYGSSYIPYIYNLQG